MFNRKFSSNIRRKKRMIILSVILLVVFLSTGYAVFTTSLGISGTLNVSKYDHTLYGVLEKAAKKGTYAKEYTGEHQDSMAGVGTEKIYHWYAPTGTAGNDKATEILDKNNVIFANHCWQMIRTTDTGGVKMIYNGEPENNQCLNNRGAHLGYAQKSIQTMSTTYYYGTSYIYDKTNKVFSLDGTVTTGEIKRGQYTCKQTTSTGTCATLYLVDAVYNGTTYYYALSLDGNSNYSQFGTLPFNSGSSSPAYVGYMYNAVYPVSKEQQNYYIESSNMAIDTSNYYSETIDYGNINANSYTLTNPISISTLSDYSTLVGKYVMNNAVTVSSEVRHVLAVNGTTIYYKTLSRGNLNISMQAGDNYIDNGNGTYTITNPTEVTYVNWYNGNYLSNEDKYVCDGPSATCSNLRHIAYSTKDYYYYWGVENLYKYSESASYNGTTYTLTGDIKEIWDVPANQTAIATHRYTCLNTDATCTTVDYICGDTAYGLSYVILSNVADISTALTNMLSVDGVNQKNSAIKTGIDAWYNKYMTDYTSRLEDAIFCNERRIESLGGWNPNGTDLSSDLRFSAIDLSCANTTDKFSMANAKATLTYPVGLLTYKEADLLNNSNIIKTGRYYWTISPYFFSRNNGAFEYHVNNGGSFGGSIVNVTYSQGVRPVISLKPGTEYASGTGSMADPYIVDVPMATLTINYRSDTGVTLHEPYVETMPVGANYSVTSPVISGYTTSQPVVSNTMGKYGATINVLYYPES